VLVQLKTDTESTNQVVSPGWSSGVLPEVEPDQLACPARQKHNSVLPRSGSASLNGHDLT
jgi:hypothetical protein